MPEENSSTESTTNTAGASVLNSTAQNLEAFAEKQKIFNSVLGTVANEATAAPTFEEATLRVLDVSDVKAVQQVTDLINCGKNLPNALVGIAIKKAISYLGSIPITGTALDLIQVLTLIQRIYEQYQILMELIEMLKDPETLLMMLANAKILEGQSLLDKIDDIKSKFPEIPGVDGLLENLNELDLCNAGDLSIEGILGISKKIPMTEIPEAVKSFGKSLITSESYLTNRSKDGDYTSLLFKIRESTLKDDTFLSEIRKSNDTTKLSQYNQMLSLVNVLGYSLHDDLKKTGDTSQHSSFKQKYFQNVETELAKYSNLWSSDIVDDYKKRTSAMGASLTSNTKVVNEYYNRNLSSSGAASSDYGGISKAAFDMIVYYEVGGESAYNSRYKKPIWPGGASGITIGIGYDIGYNTAAGLSGDWSGKISDSDISRLSACVGVKGSAAKAKLSSVSDIVIPWSAALEVYKTKTLPRFIRETLRAFPNADKLSPDAFGALVSLVFNRGGSTSGKNREEMANIRKALTGEIKVDNVYTYVADQIVAMKRIWANSNLPGLLVRRDKEASFVRSGASSGSNVA